MRSKRAVSICRSGVPYIFRGETKPPCGRTSGLAVRNRGYANNFGYALDMRREAGCRHQANGDDKLAAIDTLDCYFGEGASTGWGRKISRDKGYSRKRTHEGGRDKDKEKATGEARSARRLLLDDCARRLHIPFVCRH